MLLLVELMIVLSLTTSTSVEWRRTLSLVCLPFDPQVLFSVSFRAFKGFACFYKGSIPYFVCHPWVSKHQDGFQPGTEPHLDRRRPFAGP